MQQCLSLQMVDHFWAWAVQKNSVVFESLLNNLTNHCEMLILKGRKIAIFDLSSNFRVTAKAHRPENSELGITHKSNTSTLWTSLQ